MAESCSRSRNSFVGAEILSRPGRKPASVNSFTRPCCIACNPTCTTNAITTATLTSSQNLFEARLKIFLPPRPQFRPFYRRRLPDPPPPFEQTLDILLRSFFIQQ